MFTRLLAALGMSNHSQKSAAGAARKAFTDTYPGEPIAWIEIGEDEPTHFNVRVHYGHRQPKACRNYAVDKETFEASEIQESPAS
jgi:hypothetical protein